MRMTCTDTLRDEAALPEPIFRPRSSPEMYIVDDDAVLTPIGRNAACQKRFSVFPIDIR